MASGKMARCVWLIETAEEFFGITRKCDRHCGYVYYIDCENHHRAGADALMCAKLFPREVKDAGWTALDEMPWCEGKL